MDTDLNSPARAPAAPAVSPFPPAKQGRPAATPADALHDDGAKPAGDVPHRTTQVAHDVIEGLSAKVSGAASDAQDKVDQVLQTPAEWAASVRDAIREHPLLAIGGALLVGAVLNALLPPSRSER